MAATTIRIRPGSHQALKEMAAMTGRPVQDLLDEAIAERQRKLYLEGAAQDYAALKRDPKAYTDFKKDLAAWDVANLDGLEKL